MSPDVSHLPMRRPTARGPVSAGVLTLLGTAPGGSPEAADAVVHALGAPSPDPLHDDDRQLALTVLYELHHRGVDGVDDRWEWDPAAMRITRVLEAELETALRAGADAVLAGTDRAAPVRDVLLELTAPTSRPALAGHLARHATRAQYREWLITRSMYQLKEADPHTFAIPRISGAPKAALVEIQSDEYGSGRPEWVHAALYACAMRALGLDPRYGRYVDDVPAVWLASLNMVTFFGLHRRLRAAVAGHLAVFEMSSTMPNRLYAQGLRRLGLGDDAAAYFDEHVEADAVHEQIALDDLVGGLVRQDPGCGDDILFGAAAAVAVDAAASAHLLDRWLTVGMARVS